MSDQPPIDALKALGHPVRLRIMQALQAGERNVGEIETATGIGQPGLSQQLAVLRSAGLVDTRKDAKLVFYRIEAKNIASLIDALSPFATSAAKTGEAVRINLPPPSSGVANFARLTRS